MGEHRWLVVGLLLVALASASAAEPPVASPAASPATASDEPATAGDEPAPTEASAAIVVRVTPSTAEVGEVLDASVTYRWPVSWQAPAPPSPIAAFEDVWVDRLDEPVRRETADTIMVTWTMAIIADRSGAWSLPRPAMTFRDEDDQPVTVRANEVLVHVGAITDDAALTPADPRPLWGEDPVSTNADTAARPWWWWVIAGALLAAVIAWLVAWLRRAPPADPPAVVFDRALAAARQGNNGKEASARLSAALRDYVGRQWDFDGLGATTREIAYRLRDRCDDEAWRTLNRLLSQLDDLRWAAPDLSIEAVKPLCDQAAAWVRAEEARRAAPSEEAASQEPRGSAA